MMNTEARLRLQAARKRMGLSLRQLAEQIGVSASLLSQIENGKSDPSVSTLYALVGALGLSLDVLFESAPASIGDPSTSSPATVDQTAAASSCPIAKPGERRILHMDSGVTWERLTRGPSDLVEALLVKYEPGSASSSTGKLMTHPGWEFAYLISGELTLQLAFETYHLRAGDSLEFESSTPHCYVNEGTVPAQGLWYVVGRETVPTRDSLLRNMAHLPNVPRGTPTRLQSAVDVLESFQTH